MLKKLISNFRFLHPLKPTNINFQKIKTENSRILKIELQQQLLQQKKSLPTIIDLKGHVDRH